MIEKCTRKQKIMSHTWGKKIVGIITEKVQRSELLDKEFKSVLISFLYSEKSRKLCLKNLKSGKVLSK